MFGLVGKAMGWVYLVGVEEGWVYLAVVDGLR